MMLDKSLEAMTKKFSEVKLGGRKSDPKLVELDRGVLTVGLLLSALDGEIFPEEYAAIQTLAKKCRGGSAKNMRTVLDAALLAAGPLMAMAQSGAYAEKDRLEAFLAAAEDAMPSGFADGSLADMRRAFSLWVTIGVADGEFSKLEKTALELLSWRFASVRVENGKKKGVAKAFRLLELSFLEKAEAIVRELATPSKHAKAEAALEALIATVQAEDEQGNAVERAASDLLVGQAAMQGLEFSLTKF